MAIAILQAFLIDLGHPLPSSTRKAGVPDGVFGQETKQAILHFQGRSGLKADGIVGRKTITKLGERLCALRPKATLPPPPPPPPAEPVIGKDKFYKIGAEDPKAREDAGGGKWNSKPKQTEQKLLHSVITSGAFQAAFRIQIGPNAVEHLMHFMANTGQDKVFDIRLMTTQSPSAKATYEGEFSRAQAFVETLPEGQHFITANRVKASTTVLDPSYNWAFTTGGYQYWGKGIAVVRPGPSYRLEFRYHVFDRYNWDGKKGVDIPLPAGRKVRVTDDELAEFHRQGLAREYNQRGSFLKVYEWKPGGAQKDPGEYFNEDLY